VHHEPILFRFARDGDVFQADEDGAELRDLRSAHQEAVRTLARDKTAGDETPYNLVIYVRDAGGPVMEVACKCRRLTGNVDRGPRVEGSQRTFGISLGVAGTRG
jgi:hypothetical protein